MEGEEPTGSPDPGWSGGEKKVPSSSIPRCGERETFETHDRPRVGGKKKNFQARYASHCYRKGKKGGKREESL